jgi:opacity protein-like surface antigen
MSLRLISFGLISAVVLMSVPAFADDAVIQDSRQENVVTGDRSNAINSSRQSSETDSRRRSGNTGTSQRNDQVNDVQGNDNNAINVNDQKSKHKRR